MKQVFAAFAIFWGFALACAVLICLWFFGYVIYIFEFPPPPPKPSINSSKPATSSTATPPTQTLPVTLPPANPTIDLSRYTGSPQMQQAKALRDLETGSFSDAPVAASRQEAVASNKQALLKNKPAVPARQSASCATRMAWHFVVTTINPATQIEQPPVQGKLCLDFAANSNQTLLGMSHWEHPDARSDSVVGVVQGNTLVLERQVNGDAVRYSGTAAMQGSQALGRTTVKGNWVSKTNASMQGTWVATPMQAQ
jgi:hypothetical protein